MREATGLDKTKQEECKRLIKLHRTYKLECWKIRRRNEVFEIVCPFMTIWVKSILKKWGRYEESGDILSISWDAFSFCFDRYNNFEVPIPKFFHDFTRYFLLIKYAKEDKVHIHIDELKETLRLIPYDTNIQFDNLITLMQFREVLPEEHQIVWDDAAYSLSLSPKERYMTHTHGLTQNTYFSLKRSFKEIIRLIMGIKK